MSTGRLAFVAALAIAVVFGAGVAVGVQRLDDPATYQATSVVMIDQPRAIAAVPGPGIIDKLSRLRLKYAGLLRTRELQEPIADVAGLDVDEVAASLHVDLSADSLLMSVRGRSHDADLAEAVATAAAEHLIAYVAAEQRAVDVPAGERFAFRVVTPVDGAVDVTDVQARVLPLVASGFGLLAALGAAVVAFRRR